MRVIATLLCFGLSLVGQATGPVEIRLCEAWQHPERYAGQLVRFRAELHYGRRILLRDGRCGPIPWAYPLDPEVEPKPPFELVKDEAFHRVEASIPLLLPDPKTEKRGYLLATVEGRFDSVFKIRRGKVVRNGKGFGHLGLYDNRLVLRRVEDVAGVKPD